jgi:uncharacterized protein (TIGR02680 family)
MSSRADRFRPSRYGIVSLYEYGDQVFAAEDGRLALRGRNTSGKSKALELLVPFVLDGDITPRKLDPFMTQNKTMRWNLIECTDERPGGRAGKRIGYAWLEFARRTPDGEERWITCGVGLEATRSADGVKDRWYFVTPQRIGAELQLTKATADGARRPLARSELQECLADGSQMFATQTEYKDALRSQLFPFPSRELYEQMLEVVRELRKPGLADHAKPSDLATILSKTLPAIDDSVMRKLGDALERLQGIQRDCDELRETSELIARLADGEYRAYARGVIAIRGAALRTAETGFENAREQARRRKRRSEQLGAELQLTTAKVSELDRRHRQARIEYEQLISSTPYQLIAQIASRQHARDEMHELLQRAKQKSSDSRERVTTLDQELAESTRGVEEAAGVVEQRRAELADLAVSARLVDVSAECSVDELEARVTVREGEIDCARQLLARLIEANATFDALAGALARAERRRDEARDHLTQAETALAIATDAFELVFCAWREQLVELEIDEASAERLVSLGCEDGGFGTAIDELVRQRAQPLADRLAQARTRLSTASQMEEQIADEIAELETARQLLPNVRSPRRGNRDERPGAALWTVCDFAEHVAEVDRGPLEAALEEAGLLDAWISPDGTIADSDATLIAPDSGAADGTLGELLVPAVEDQPLAAAAVARVLAAIPRTGVLSIEPGAFRFGPLHGRFAKPAAEFIGPAARARHRAARLADARARLVARQTKVSQAREEVGQAEAAQRHLEEERHAIVDASEFAEIRQRARTMRGRELALAGAEVEFDAARAERADAERKVLAASKQLSEYVSIRGLPGDGKGLDDASRALRRIELAAGLARKAGESHTEREQHRVRAAAHVEAGHALLRAFVDDEQDAERRLAEAEGALRASQSARSDDGEAVSDLEARAERLRNDRDHLDAELSQTRDAREQLSLTIQGADRDHEDAEEKVQRAAGARTVALDAVRALGAHDLFSAGLGDEAPSDERASAGWTLTTALERLRALPTLDGVVDVERRASRVAKLVSELALSLARFEIEAFVRPEGELQLVAVSIDGDALSLVAARRNLLERLETRERTLSQERRRLLSESLMEEIAEHLRRRIAAVKASVRDRNRVLARTPTPRGRRVEIEWQPAVESDGERAVLAMLAADQSVALLEEHKRSQLFAFFEDRIAFASTEVSPDIGEEESALNDYLAKAFDYRRWFEFVLYLREGESRKLLTDRSKGVGSGGEQAMLLQLPLMATAASLYDMVPTAPRLVALDEAMEKIDSLNRENVLALLVELDLDLFLTSFDLNPCVRQLPAIGFYELHREEGTWGVWAQHFRWDGELKTEVVEG